MLAIKSSENRTSATFTAYLLLAWFTLVLIGSLQGLFVQQAGPVPLLLGLAAGGPVLLFIAAYLLSTSFRSFIRSLIKDPWAITALQAYRVLGIVFVILASRNALPELFAQPAGWGDFFIGITAPFVALAWSSGSRSGKALFVLWNVLGMLDLLMAVSLGILTPILQPGAVTTAAMRIFPLSIIPAFLVPLSFILHVAGLGQFFYLSRKNA